MDELGEAERQVVASYWWQRAHGELTSFHGFQHVLADLRDEQAAPAVIELAERAVQDEYQHAQWCRDWALRFGHPGGEITPRGERPIAFRGATEAQNRLLRIALCCMNECGYAACSRVTLRATSTACALQLLRTCSGKTVSCAVAPISV